jgi:ABC-type sugar transport system ATPase subunit
MGRALVREPAVSLLDEPLSNLDAKLRVQVRAEIAELQERTRTTMLYVTHDQVEAMTLGHRVAVMDKGRLQQVAPPRELYDAPANAFVAGFIGNPPINLFPPRLQARDATLVVGGHALPVRGAPLPRDASSDERAVIAGIRPEHLRLAGEAAPALPVAVEHVEWLGHETLAHLRADVRDGGDLRLVARLPGMQALAPGDRAAVELDAPHVRFFTEDGTALTA